jgi:hypothetical protein
VFLGCGSWIAEGPISAAIRQADEFAHDKFAHDEIARDQITHEKEAGWDAARRRVRRICLTTPSRPP